MTRPGRKRSSKYGRRSFGPTPTFIVGQGKHLFSEQKDLKTLKLTDYKTIGPDGIIALTYARP